MNDKKPGEVFVIYEIQPTRGEIRHFENQEDAIQYGKGRGDWGAAAKPSALFMFKSAEGHYYMVGNKIDPGTIKKIVPSGYNEAIKSGLQKLNDAEQRALILHYEKKA
jgi:hypothetical protein